MAEPYNSSAEVTPDLDLLRDYMKHVGSGGEPSREMLEGAKNAMERVLVTIPEEEDPKYPNFNAQNKAAGTHMLRRINERLQNFQGPANPVKIDPQGTGTSEVPKMPEGQATSEQMGQAAGIDNEEAGMVGAIPPGPPVETEGYPTPQVQDGPMVDRSGITVQAAPSLPGPTALQRAAKYNLALDTWTPGIQQLFQSVNQPDQEDIERQRATLQSGEEARQIKNDTIKEMVLQGDVDGAVSFAEAPHTQTAPGVVFEKLYGDRVIDSMISQTNMQDLFRSSYLEDPDKTVDLMSLSSNMIARKEIFQKLLENTEEKWKQSGLLSQAADVGSHYFVPFLSWYRLSNLPSVPGTEPLMGGQIAARVRYLWSLPLEQARSEATAMADQLYSKNPALAVDFLRGLMSFSTQDELLGNLVSVGDIGTGVSALTGTARFAKALRSVAVSNAGKTTTVSEVLEAAGDTSSAAKILAQRISENPNTVPKAFEELRGQVMSFANPGEITAKTGNALSREEAQRIERTMVTNRDRMEAIVNGTIEIPRLPEEVIAKGVRDTETLWRYQYPHLNDRVMNVRHIRDAETNTHHVAVELGNPSGGLFVSEESARNTATDLMGLKKFNIKQQGAGYYVEVTKPVDESAASVRGQLSFETKNTNPTPRGWLGQIRGYLLNKDAVLPKDLQESRVTASYAASGLIKRLEQVLEPIMALNKAERNDFTKFVQAQRTYIDPSTKKPGRFSNTLFDFESDFTKTIGRVPTAKEANAYFNYTQMYDFDWMLYNMGLYRDKAARGLEVHSFKGGPAGVEGKLVADKPWANNPENARILVINKDGSHEILQSRLQPHRDKLDKMEGARAFHVSPTGEGVVHDWLASQPRPVGTLSATFEHPTENFGGTLPVAQRTNAGLSVQAKTMKLEVNETRRKLLKKDAPKISIGDENMFVNLGEASGVKGRSYSFKAEPPPIDFVVAYDHATEPLSFKQIPHQPGGHIAYPNHGFYVSIPDVRPVQLGGVKYNYYYGDTNLWRFSSQSIAQRFVERFNQARQMHLAGDEAGLERFLQQNFPDDLNSEKFRAMFSNPDLKIRPENAAFLRRHGTNLSDDAKLKDSFPNFVKRSDSSYNLYSGLNIGQAMERGMPIKSIEEMGTQANPYFKFIDAPMLDPMATIGRSMDQLTRGRYLDDLKAASAERFVAEFYDLLGIPLAEARKNPFQALLNAPFRANITDQKALAAAQAYRRAAQEFFGTRTPLQEKFSHIFQRLHDMTMESNSKVANAVGDKLVEPYLLMKEPNPAKFWKSTAFHYYLGMFNPKQLVTQAMTVTNTAAFAGISTASKAGAIAAAIRPVMINESKGIVDSLAAMVSTTGLMKREHFLEAFDAFRRSGMWNVGREISVREGVMQPNIVQTQAGAFLKEKTAVFFNEGERFNRGTAFFSAYINWRDANPQAAFTDKVVRQLVGQANTYAGSMSQANRASWEKGLASIPAQFLAFKARIMDQMIFGGSGELTVTQRAKLFGIYSAMWGVPVAAGSALPVWPWHKELREDLLQRGINVSDNAMTSLIAEGIPGLIRQSVDLGTPMNWGEGFGPGGTDMLRDIAQGKKTVFEVLGGPVGNLITKMKTAAEPFGMALLGTISNDDHYFPLDLKDFADAAAVVTSSDMYQKGLFAFFTGQYLSRNGQAKTDNLSGYDAFLIGTLGVKPQELSDMDAMLHNLDRRHEYNKAMQKEAINEYRMAYQAGFDNRFEDQEKHLRRAKTILNATDMNGQERARVLSLSTKNYETMLESVSRKYGKLSPEQREAFIRRLQTRQGQE